MRFYEGYYVLKKIVSGRLVELSIYQMPIGKSSRSVRRNLRNKEKQQRNAKAAVKKLARLLTVNFTEHDAAVVLTYSDLAVLCKDMPDDLTADEQSKYIYRAAERQLRLFFDRMRRTCKKAGVPLRYAAITSDMDGATGKPERVHHHVVVNFEARPYVEQAWKKQGFVFSKKVNVHTDGFPLAFYLLSQVRHQWNAKKFITSRGLTKSQEVCSIVSSTELPEPPTGAVVFERTANSIVYVLPETK